MMTAKLRHNAISVPELRSAAEFYNRTFGLEEVLSDGVINLTVLTFHCDDAAGDERGKEFHGLHHIGFVVDDFEKYTDRVKANGGRFHRELKGGSGVDFERKFRDPNGVVFDISHKGWVGIEE
jgi:lactoylglutathione lyase